MAIFVDLHAIQTMGPNNLNRDLNGAPKSAMFGGVKRARVSSQALKSSMRRDFNERYSPQNLGIRTKRIVKLLAEEIMRVDSSVEEEDAREIAIAAFAAAGIKIDGPKPKEDEQAPLSDWVSKYLIFLSTTQIEAAAEVALTAFRDQGIEGVKRQKKELQNALNSDLSVDLALFGRMVAEDANLNVDASCQVAHALSTHQVETEFDFFTAVDDEKKQAEEADAGAGMMGTVEFGSSTLYRYATINATSLARQLGSVEAAVKAIEGFVDVFATSLPTGKQNTFAAHSFPSAIVASIRTDRPSSWVGAFERPVYPHTRSDSETGGYTSESVSRLFEYASSVDSAYGSPVSQIVLLTDDANTRSPLLDASDVVDSLARMEEKVGLAVEEQLETR